MAAAVLRYMVGMPQVQLRVRSTREASAARRAVRRELLDRGLDEPDIVNVELVVSELLGAAHDADVRVPMLVTIDTFSRLHNVRVCGIPNVEVDDAPFHLRERVLHALTLAFGQRRNADGTIDLWAEVPRSA
jgi:hypothetical protein